MAKLNDDGQWIILMGFVVSITLFILALIVAESALVGKTTADSVLQFPKTDIQDYRAELMSLKFSLPDWNGLGNNPAYNADLTQIMRERKSACISYSTSQEAGYNVLNIYYNDGLTFFGKHIRSHPNVSR